MLMQETERLEKVLADKQEKLRKKRDDIEACSARIAASRDELATLQASIQRAQQEHEDFKVNRTRVANFYRELEEGNQSRFEEVMDLESKSEEIKRSLKQGEARLRELSEGNAMLLAAVKSLEDELMSSKDVESLDQGVFEQLMEVNRQVADTCGSLVSSLRPGTQLPA